MPRASAASTEIDEIFGSKSTAGCTIPSLTSKGKGKAKASDENITTGAAAKKKKKIKKNKVAQTQVSSHTTESAVNPTSTSNAKRKRPEPETVFDPSTTLSTSAKRLKGPAKITSAVEGKTKKNEMNDEERFRDSRGTELRRKTDDGFSIYKEDELGIGEHGGDTPLCPFDCDCCF